MNKGLTIFLVLAATGAGAYLYYRSQKKAKALITIPAIAPTVTPTPSWLEALKVIISSTPAVTQPGEYWSEGVRYTPSIDPVTGLPFAI